MKKQALTGGLIAFLAMGTAAAQGGGISQRGGGQPQGDQPGESETGGGEAENAQQGNAQTNAGGEEKPAAAAQNQAGGGDPTAILDARLRTFSGPCLVRPLGGGQQAAFAGLLGALVPKVVGTGIDLLSGALEKAGQDNVTIITAVLPLEHRPACIQIARDPKINTSALVGKKKDEIAAKVREGLLAAPFLVEFYLRQSQDGSAVALMPTLLRYTQSIDGSKTGRRPRDLYATIHLVPFGGKDTSSVSVPLGRFAPRPGTGFHYYDPVLGNPQGIEAFPTGAAASPWVMSPFVNPASVSRSGGGPAQPPPSEQEQGRGQPQDRRQIVRTGTGAGTFGDTVIPGSGNRQKGQADKPAADGAEPPKDPPTPTIPVAEYESTVPYTIKIDLRETEPGSPFARVLASLLKSSRETLVNAVDPAKQQEARKTELDSWKTAQSGYATTLADYYKKRAAFCTGASNDAELKGREIAAADLLESQIKLAAAVRIADDAQAPFRSMVVPGAPNFVRDCG